MMEWSWDAAMPIPMAIPVTTKRTASRYERDEAFTLMILSHVHRGAKIGCAEAPSRPRRDVDDEVGKSRGVAKSCPSARTSRQTDHFARLFPASLHSALLAVCHGRRSVGRRCKRPKRLPGTPAIKRPPEQGSRTLVPVIGAAIRAIDRGLALNGLDQRICFQPGDLADDFGSDRFG